MENENDLTRICALYYRQEQRAIGGADLYKYCSIAAIEEHVFDTRKIIPEVKDKLTKLLHQKENECDYVVIASADLADYVGSNMYCFEAELSEAIPDHYAKRNLHLLDTGTPTQIANKLSKEGFAITEEELSYDVMLRDLNLSGRHTLLQKEDLILYRLE